MRDFYSNQEKKVQKDFYPSSVEPKEQRDFYVKKEPISVDQPTIKQKDFYSKAPDRIEQTPQEKKEAIKESVKGNSFWKSIFDSVGKAGAVQAGIGEVRTPEQAKAVTDFAKEITSSASLTLSETLPGMETPEQSDTKFLSEVIGTALPITGFEKAVISPLVKTIKSAGKAGKYIAPFARMAGWGGFGITKKGTESLVNEGELPSAKELLKEGASWAALDGIVQGAGLGIEFGASINRLAKDSGVSNKEMLKHFFKSVKNKGFDMLKKPPTAQEAIDIVGEIANKPFEKATIDITPKEVIPKPKANVPEVIPKPKVEANVPEIIPKVKAELSSLNPTGGISAEYTPNDRANIKLGKNITTLDKTIEKNPNETITIYRGAPKSQKEIVPGDYITTNKQLAKDYAGEGKILEKEVKLSDILDDKLEPLGEEYIYRPEPVKPLDVVKPKELSKPKQVEDVSAQKVSKEVFKTKSTPKETIEQVSREPSELYQPPIYGEEAKQISLLDKAISKLPKYLQKKSPLAKKAWEIRQDYYGKRMGLDMRYKQKWNTILKDNKFSADTLEDMIFYIEDPKAIDRSVTDKGTGNPFKGKDDTWYDINKRLPKEAKEAVKIVKQHFKDMLQVLNDSPYVKNINPREFLEQIYVPHFYDGKVKEALGSVMKQKKFSTSNPLANTRKYATFNDALREAGLVPKYRNINDLLNNYDAIMIRVLSNSELAGQISELEKELGSKLIARPNNGSLYKQAKAEGWVEFSDPYLRRRVVGKKDGKPIFATSEANALVHPDIAPSLEGIFSKEAYKPDNMALRGMDWYNDQVRQIRVQFSPMFHMGALSESMIGATGPKGFKDMISKWDVIFSDPAFNEFAAESGLKFGIPSDTAMKNNRVLFDSALSKIELLGGKRGLASKGLRAGLEKSQAGAQFLFNELHPRMKMTTFSSYLAQVERKALKKGVKLTPEWRKKAGREIASIVNDQFGGQMWELMRFFSNPDNLKLGRRLISYLDWTTSALRQMTSMFEDVPQIIRGEGPSIRGTLGRKYNARYLAYVTLFSQMMSYLYTGMENRKDKDGKNIPNSITWNYDKAHSTFGNKDPKHHGYASQLFHYQLPDLEYNIAGIKFNPGRDSNGRRRYSHAGKQFLEVGRYATNFVGQLYNKSTAFIQLMAPLILDTTPGEGDWKPRGVWSGGKTIPWDGSEPWSLDRLKSKSKYVLDKTFTNFSIAALIKDTAAFPFVFFGTTPISKGIGISASEKYYKDYYRVIFGDGYNSKSKEEARKRVTELDNVLLDNKYNVSQIKRKKTSARNYVNKNIKSKS